MWTGGDDDGWTMNVRLGLDRGPGKNPAFLANPGPGFDCILPGLIKNAVTRKLSNFYLGNVASIRFNTLESIVLDTNIIKIWQKKFLTKIFF